VSQTCLLEKRTRVSSRSCMGTTDEDALYKAIGERIRRERERQAEPLSQSALAKQLEVSRASVVNIEAGRQRAPLGLLWKIACHMDVELTVLIPSRADLNNPSSVAQLTEEMRNQLRRVTKGDQQLESEVSGFIAQAVAQLAGAAGQPVQQKRKRST
jgi:transcriptional regulator with XRE-family HTH domain